MSIKVNDVVVVDGSGNADWADIKDRPWVTGDQGDQGVVGDEGTAGGVGPQGRHRTRIQYYQQYYKHCDCACMTGA
ncbi:hypothetical protein N9112_00015 [bacterium]|nr:hypothetical protein [bacterium]